MLFAIVIQYSTLPTQANRGGRGWQKGTQTMLRVNTCSHCTRHNQSTNCCEFSLEGNMGSSEYICTVLHMFVYCEVGACVNNLVSSQQVIDQSCEIVYLYLMVIFYHYSFNNKANVSSINLNCFLFTCYFMLYFIITFLLLTRIEKNIYRIISFDIS